MTAKRYDIESVMFDIQDFLKEELNDEIQAVFDEKNDGLSYDQLKDDAYSVQSMDDKVLNYPIFCLLELMEIAATGNGPATSKELSIAAILVVSGKPNQKEAVRRMFRYGRALETVFQRNWDRISKHRIKFNIQSIPPLDYTDLNATKSFKSVAVVLSGALPS